MRRMRADCRWQEARLIPRSEPQARTAAFAALRKAFGFSEYALHAFATEANTSWIAEHLDANTAQTLASRAYQATNRVCIGQARRVRFRRSGRGLESLEGKTNKQEIRFVLQQPPEGTQGWLVWGQDPLAAVIDWNDPVVHHGLRQRIKYARLLRRKASSPCAKGADRGGYRYYAQLALEGMPYQKPKHPVGQESVGLDLGPSTIAIVPEQGQARLETFCAENPFACRAGTSASPVDRAPGSPCTPPLRRSGDDPTVRRTRGVCRFRPPRSIKRNGRAPPCPLAPPRLFEGRDLLA